MAKDTSKPVEQPAKVEPKNEEAVVVEYPTATARAVKVGEQVYDQLDFLVLVYNDLQKIKKAVL